jgi:hypothetical protein
MFTSSTCFPPLAFASHFKGIKAQSVGRRRYSVERMLLDELKYVKNNFLLPLLLLMLMLLELFSRIIIYTSLSLFKIPPRLLLLLLAAIIILMLLLLLLLHITYYTTITRVLMFVQ